LEGEPVLKVQSVKDESIDRNKLRAAIRRRRDESRRINKEWEEVDREMWDKIS
jgi:hypothetical protein